MFYLDHLWFYKALGYLAQWVVAHVLLPLGFVAIIVVGLIWAGSHESKRRAADSDPVRPR